ncbi:adenosine deaminase [Elsinoe ampelina]|uniref:Adenine deaminase n=1 Tax=Elsinoe ampelina TaxID=302913 RepID=A0A6A6G3Q4_9PEZI|nr:adenosine deaminase [Elsinoe ampelina]
MSVDDAFLTALPKCEHHLHIEGTLSPTDLFTLAKRNSIPLPTDDPAYTSIDTLTARYKQFTSLDDFLAYYYRGMDTLIHAADFELLTWSYLLKAHSQGVHHAEIFFDPQAHTTRSIPLPTVVAGIKAACARAHRELGMSTLLIPCFLRHLPVASALETLHHPDFIAAVQSKDFVGIGLDSSENGFPPELFVQIYKDAREMGLRVTAHAGEEGPAENVIKCLDLLGCERIDHGIRAGDDAALMERLAREEVLVTMCPLSNVALRCVGKVEELPIRKFLDTGVRFSVNSDDPEYLGGYILDSYKAVQEAFGLNREEWVGICRWAIEGSWCGKERKDELMGLLGKV